MKNSEFCNINNLTFSQTSVRYLNELEDTAKVGNYLASGFSAIEFVNIFADRKYHKVVKNITTNDWEEFSKALLGIHRMTKNAAERVVSEAINDTKGEENAFWTCMYRALR
ncbi:hypothetical protein A6D98_19665 [Aliivibrio fischeri]|uniref:hypothetical protein n=1 Tax=Aliivibrio fischeri TaxID=668 RepID=UPI00080E115B|nr:hypothetical protein [Aliivibrio fischeri]OCH57255.1 hypothetical protein A6D98_19665 [Aliivibrio fischeri]